MTDKSLEGRIQRLEDIESINTSFPNFIEIFNNSGGSFL